MFKFMYNPLSDMPCYKALLFFKFMLIQKIFPPPGNSWSFFSLFILHYYLVSECSSHSFLMVIILQNILHKAVSLIHTKAFLHPWYYSPFPSLFVWTFCSFFFFFFDYSCTLSRSCLWTCCTPSLLCWCLQQQSH